MKKIDLRWSALGEIQVALMLFAQALSIQILVYPLAFISIARNATKLLPMKVAAGGCMLIGYVALSILYRGGSAELLIKLVQFYFGLVFVTMAFHVDRTLRVGPAAFWLFSLLIFYEMISSNIFGVEPFLYSHSGLAGVDAAAKANIGFGLARAYGPALNSSVSGSILAIMFFFIISRSGNPQDNECSNKKYLAASALLAFVLCGSVTSYMVFIFLLIFHVTGGRRESGFAGLTVVSSAFASVILVLLLSLYALSDFFDALIESKINADYFELVWNLKIEQASQALRISNLLFGDDLSDVAVDKTGGDFVLLDAILKVGLLGLLGLFTILFYCCPRENRIFLFAGVLSSFHYGTVFALSGQVFFGALCANAVSFERKPK